MIATMCVTLGDPQQLAAKSLAEASAGVAVVTGVLSCLAP